MTNTVDQLTASATTCANTRTTPAKQMPLVHPIEFGTCYYYKTKGKNTRISDLLKIVYLFVTTKKFGFYLFSIFD